MLAPSLPKPAGRTALAAGLPVAKTQAAEPKLDSLTSLRFIAAAMIVVSHSAGLFNLDPHRVIENLPLAQGVSFFFVLSGFILTYVYRDLSGFKPFLHFLAARIARVWPVFFFAAITTYTILPATMIAKAPVDVALTVVSQFFMLHGWIPERLFYFSLNSPSWSISTEFFFYLAFPFLIINLRKTWLPKLIAITALPVALVLLAGFFNLPPLGEETQVSSHGLLYINPLSRIFEFYLGMLTCLVVVKLKTYELNRAVLTATEIGAFALIATLLCNIEPCLFRLGLNSSAPQLQIYLKYCGNALGYVLLIASVGIERGYVSKLLKSPVLIFLGEVSYSVYLLHYPLIALYKQNSLIFLTMPRFLRYGLFWAALLAFSSISYFLLEKPARKFFRKLFNYWIEKLDPKPNSKPDAKLAKKPDRKPA